MKKFFSVMLTICALNITYGQTYGVKGGLNVADVKKEWSEDNRKPRIGWNAGVLAEIAINKQFLVRPELIYSSKGYSFPAYQSNSKGTVSINYFNVPILFGYKATEQLTVLAGPEFGYLVGAKTKFADGKKIDNHNSFEKFDKGIDLGLAYKLNKNIGAEVRYNYGFTGLVHLTYMDQYGNIIREEKVGAHRVLQLGVYYLFTK